MISRATNMLVAVAIGIATMPAGDASAQSGPAAEDFFGVNIQILVYDMPDRLERQLDAVRDAGVDVVRFDAAWNAVEPNPPVDGVHRFHWTRFDPVVRELAERGLRWLPVVGYSARWATSQPGNLRAPPREVADYAGFAGALASRYGRNGSFWRENPSLPATPVTHYEIWNAPNYEATAFPADRYASAYLLSRAAIRAADPEARVLVGGLALGAPDFLREIVRHRPELRHGIDGVGLHPYADKPGGVFGYVAELRAAMDQLGQVDVPIAVTEVGWATQGRQSVPQASDRARAEYYGAITDVLTRSDCGVGSVLPHTWVTLERNPMDAGHWFGIFRANGRHTATSRAYASAIAENRQWQQQGGQADTVICDRQPELTVSSRFHRARRAARPARRAASRRAGRRLRARTCQRATVTLADASLGSTNVLFRYRDRRGRVRRSVTRITNTNGAASDCVIKPRRRRRSERWRVQVSASRPDLAHVANTSARVLVR